MDKAQELQSLLNRMNCGTESINSNAPLIGISGNFVEGECRLAQAYYMSVIEAGGTPIVIPSYDNLNALISIVNRLDGIILSGGADIDPLFLGEDPIDGVSINPRRDCQELLLVRLAVQRHIPMLGICRGIQMLAAALGGKLYQDIKTQHSAPLLEHSQKEARAVATHEVMIEDGTLLSSLFGKNRICVNSFHHQAVKEVPQGFRVSAIATDGVIEGMESTSFQHIMGVQWHPESFIMEHDRVMMPIFEWLVSQSRLFHRARVLHDSTLILDSHCDSPMFFDVGARFCNTAQPIEVRYDYVGEQSPDGSATFLYTPLVDIHKMAFGKLDASFMVAYLKQGELDADSLKAAVTKADRLLTLIDDRIGECEGRASIATTPHELYLNKLQGVKSIVKGIENGYAVGQDVENVVRFRNRGVAYMTLCHNGDNDICDSHKGDFRHNGLSAFGRSVVERMNRVGMMVDLSHASQKSFYDALEYSGKPIICSHSSCSTLCEHTRNLTDDQMRALASTGGVAQLCLYSGFLRKEGRATIEDAVRHILYMIEVMGVEHVGIGSDFDGGGGVLGLEDASSLTALTSRLMAHGLTERELSLIWGENLLRVWRQNLE